MKLGPLLERVGKGRLGLEVLDNLVDEHVGPFRVGWGERGLGTQPLQHALEVSAVIGLLKEMDKDFAAVQAIMLELVGHPGVACAHAA